MENANHWVAAKLAYLDPPPEWEPNAELALKRFHEDVEMDRPLVVWRRWPAWAAAVALVLAGFLVLPAGRAVAYQVWQFLTVRRVGLIRVNRWPDGVRSPQVGVLGTPLPPIPARDLDEARWRVDYDPRLPRPGILSSSPKLYTTFSLSAGTVVNVADLELALRKVGITDQIVPPQWDGAQIALHTSPVVIAEWPDVVLTQSLPLTITTPSGFDFQAFSVLILRILGVAPEEAQRLAQRANTAPPLLIDRNLRADAALEEVQLHTGSAILLQEHIENGTRVSLLWSVTDRIYLLSGTISRDLAIAAADAVE